MEKTPWTLTRGASVQPDGGVRFSVWAPRVREMQVRCLSPARVAPMQRTNDGVYTVTLADLPSGCRYYYVLDGERERPDPVSRFQPEGVHGPSAIVDPWTFPWTDQGWRGLALRDVVLYELHVGAFTAEGTFTAILPYLDYLKNELGVTAIELMPVAEFPGARNWGYDGVHLYAPHSAYGGPEGLKTLVNACHAAGLAVALDVVYNHLGPEGNYLQEYGPYFTDRHHTPWGDAVNYDDRDSAEVRRYVIENALYWVTEYHIDILRLDAIHGICDASAVHVIRELTEAVHTQARALGRSALVIAESDLNDNRVVTDRDAGGWGVDAQWSDDFHHALHTLITGEQQGYYQDYGSLDDLVTALTEGYIYRGQLSHYRGRPHGTPSRHVPGERFVIFVQNHDQIGNRPYGERLNALAPPAALKAAAGIMLCAPNIPLLFMGEEYGETAPFLYFTSHLDPALSQAVSEGRRREFADAVWDHAVPDPQDVQTFLFSKVRHELRSRTSHHQLLCFYRDLLTLRKRTPALASSCKEKIAATVWREQGVLLVHRWTASGEGVCFLASLAAAPRLVRGIVPPGRWEKALDAEASRYGGSEKSLLPAALEGARAYELTLAPFHFALYERADVRA